MVNDLYEQFIEKSEISSFVKEDRRGGKVGDVGRVVWKDSWRREERSHHQPRGRVTFEGRDRVG